MPYSQCGSTISNYEICNDKVYAFCVDWKLLWLKSGPFLPSAYIFMRVKLMEVARRRISVFVEIAAVFAAIFGLNSSCFICYMVCNKGRNSMCIHIVVVSSIIFMHAIKWREIVLRSGFVKKYCVESILFVFIQCSTIDSNVF